MPSTAELRAQCRVFISGSLPTTPAEDFAELSRWCEVNEADHDLYGSGNLIQGFERRIAKILGKERALFCISGTMAQAIALRIACEAKGGDTVALHPTAHVLLHERENYQFLDLFRAVRVGDPFRTWSAEDLQAWPGPVSAAFYELPMREIGGQLPSWESLKALGEHCRKRGIHFHMDGARLWEAAAGYGQPASDIAAIFDSVYVSLYKGIGGLAGAMLAGDVDFIARAEVWLRRFGGNVARATPYVAAAAARFDERIARMPRYLERAKEVARVVSARPGMRVNPSEPQVNMMHVYCAASRERLTAIRDELAGAHGIWLFGAARHAPLAGESSFEWYVGDALLQMPDRELEHILDLFAERLRPSQ
ncbi:threonine aldolase family protein [Noviherbaspirillum galbum]|uniref:Threonine aldolase n=1 Tax=Noviherbaspirillum galbum TaxID=2709383 RepID=A0A6B3STP9_9BURK|nr:beta-eliminating lyase-related protein [Noviherbaspirillum galbum]NEX62236.1 threonine aldolase [Noviherbaspirillum galbum]